MFVKQKAKHHSTTLTGTVSPTTTTINFLEHFERPEIIKTGDVEMKEILGRGQFGEVHKGQWTRKINGQDHLVRGFAFQNTAIHEFYVMSSP